MKLVHSWFPYSNQYVLQEVDSEFFLRKGALLMMKYLTGEETNLFSYFVFIDWSRGGWTRKYLARGHDVRTERFVMKLLGFCFLYTDKYV